MSVPQSASPQRSSTAVLIPLRSLRDGKLRLADDHGIETHARLIDHMANVVLAAAHELDVLIVHDAPEVAEWARDRGAAVLRPTAPGLNRAIEEGHDHLRNLGYARVIVAHADLPLADDLRRVDLGEGISIVSDRHGDGTNVMCLPTTLDFGFAYGPGSFAAHCEITRRAGVEPAVLDDPRLSLDVDHPSDLVGAELEHLLDPSRINR